MLLTTSGISLHDVCPPDIAEHRQPGESPVAYARRMASEKAAAVDRPDHWILAADTVVHIDADIFGKPADDADAAHILARLSGRWHGVTTGWCLQWSGRRAGRLWSHVTTAVQFRSLTPAGIAAYIATGDGQDKAGAYGIQGLGSALVETLSGSYTNVVGLPLTEVLAALHSIGITPSQP